MTDPSSRESTGVYRMERGAESGPGTSRAEQRTSARYEVSIPMRFTVDGETFHDGVVTSISSGGLFVQAELLPSMKASVWVDVGLAPGDDRLRCAGSVVNLNRRYGSEVIYGFGVRLADTPPDLGMRIERLRAASPGPVRLDGLGFLVWPLYGGSDRSMESGGGIGLQVWNGARWLDGGPATHVVQPGTKGVVVGRPLEQYLRALRAMSPQVSSVREPLVPFGYYAKCMTPQEGVPAEALGTKMEAPTAEVSPWLRALAVQMRLIDDLASAAWRLENVWSAQIESLSAVRTLLGEARAGMASLVEGAASEELASSASQATRGLEALERYVERISWTARTVVPPDETPRAFAEWKVTRRTAALRTRARWGAETSLAAMPGGDLVPVPRRQLVVAACLMAVVLGAAGVLFVRLQSLSSVNPREAPRALAREELRRFIPLAKVVVLGKKVVGIVDSEWAAESAAERNRQFTELCQVLADRGFVEAELKTAADKSVATWRSGRIEFAQ